MGKNNTLNVSRRLSSFKYWLYEKQGLGLQQVIDNILEPLRYGLNEDELNKYKIVANVLKNNGKISESQYNIFLNTLTKKKLVYTNDKGEFDPNGSWDYVNKLNTNFYDLGDLLSELLHRSYKNDSVVGKTIINILNSGASDDECKNILLKHKHKLPQLFNDYLTSPNELLGFTSSIKHNSSCGEKLENDIIQKLKELGYEIIYQGGNGDFVDMLLSIDFIVKENDNVFTVQSKTSEYQVKKFKSDYEKGKHSAVDLLIYPTNTKYEIFMVKDKVTKEIDK